VYTGEAMTKINLDMTTTRIESLSDNVFSVAMTILVFNLTVPAGLKLSDSELYVLLTGQWHKFMTYFISFFLLAVLWIAHHQQSHFIKRTNRFHLWVNLLILMFVVLMPFSTSLTGDYGGRTTSSAFFSANMIILALLFLVNWIYATGNHRLVSHDMAAESVRKGTHRSVLFVLVSLLAFLLSFFNPHWSSLTYLLIPLINSLKSLRA
jgi:uncharacterized membrane protein